MKTLTLRILTKTGKVRRINQITFDSAGKIVKVERIDKKKKA